MSAMWAPSVEYAAFPMNSRRVVSYSPQHACQMKRHQKRTQCHRRFGPGRGLQRYAIQAKCVNGPKYRRFGPGRGQQKHAKQNVAKSSKYVKHGPCDACNRRFGPVRGQRCRFRPRRGLHCARRSPRRSLSPPRGRRASNLAHDEFKLTDVARRAIESTT